MTSTRKFQRRKENFRCGHCGCAVTGDGYTNHCPQCLYSLHVDVNPGDRAEPCRGLMTPIDFEIRGGGYIIVHQCLRCGAVRRIGMRPEDDMGVLLQLARSRAQGGGRGGRRPAAAPPGAYFRPAQKR